MKLKRVFFLLSLIFTHGLLAQNGTDQTVTIEKFTGVMPGGNMGFVVGAPISGKCGNVIFEIDFDPVLDISQVHVTNDGKYHLKSQTPGSHKVTVEFDQINDDPNDGEDATGKNIAFSVSGAYISPTSCGGDLTIQVTRSYASTSCGSETGTRVVPFTKDQISLNGGGILGNSQNDGIPLSYNFEMVDYYSRNLGDVHISLDLSNKPFKLIGASQIIAYSYDWNTRRIFNTQYLSVIQTGDKYDINFTVPNYYVEVIFYFERTNLSSIDPSANYNFDFAVSTSNCSISQSFTSPSFTLSSNDDENIVKAPALQHNAESISSYYDPCSPASSTVPSGGTFYEQINNLYNASNAYSSLVYELDVDPNVSISQIVPHVYGACANCIISKIEVLPSTGTKATVYTNSASSPLSEGQTSFDLSSYDTRKVYITFSQLPKKSSLFFEFNYKVSSSVFTTTQGSKVLDLSSKLSVLGSDITTSAYTITAVSNQGSYPSPTLAVEDYGFKNINTGVVAYSSEVNIGERYAFRVIVRLEGNYNNYKLVYDLNPYLTNPSNFKYAVGNDYVDFSSSQLSDYSGIDHTIFTSAPQIINGVQTSLIFDKIHYDNTCVNTYLTIYYEATIGPLTPSDIQYNGCNPCVSDDRNNSYYQYNTSWQLPQNNTFTFFVSSKVKCNTTLDKNVTIAPSKNYSLSVVFSNETNNAAKIPVLLVSNAFPTDKYHSSTYSTCPTLTSDQLTISGLVTTQFGATAKTSNVDYTLYYSNDPNPCLFSNITGGYPNRCNSNAWTTTCTSGSGPLYLKLVPNKSDYKLAGFSTLEFQLPYTLPATTPLNNTLYYSAVGSAQFDYFGPVYVGAKGDDDVDNNTNNPTVVKVGPSSSCDIVVSSCTDCITSFSPIPDSTYYLSAWVKESSLPPIGTQSYTSGITLVYTGTITPATDLTASFSPVGAIIDGWQRIEGTFKVPHNAESISVQLVNNSTGNAFFDDIRIHPRDASMKSFVYDPASRRLTAELDGNNYATFYDYDEEGALIRVRKETERGIMTMQESRSRQYKKPVLPDQQ